MYEKKRIEHMNIILSIMLCQMKDKIMYLVHCENFYHHITKFISPRHDFLGIETKFQIQILGNKSYLSIDGISEKEDRT